MVYLITLSPFRKANIQKIYIPVYFLTLSGDIDSIISGGEPIMKRTLPALLLCGVLLFSVPALTEDALLRSLFGWTAYFARIPADAAETPDTLEWDWTWGGFWRALFGYSA